MKVRIFKCSDPSYWYASRHVGDKFDVIGEKDDFYQVNGPYNTICFIEKKDCDVVSGDNIDLLKHGMTKGQIDAINQSLTDPNMKQIKMSIETAREWYKLAKENNTEGKTNPAINWLLENFTKEELEPKKGFTWEESLSGNGFYVSSKSEIIKMDNAYNDAYNKNLFRTKEQAESALAFAQLSHIVAKYNEGKWFKVIHGTTFYYFVTAFNGKDLGINTFKHGELMLHLPFCDFEDAKMSMEVNRELWEKYWMIKKD